MKEFLGDDFLLESETAGILYHDYAIKMPIFDYHCHLPPAQIAENRAFPNLTQLWLQGDHYKWRAMRANGVPERFCSGEADDYAKFSAWAKTVPYTLGNPLYHWTHLELKRHFGIEGKVLNSNTAEAIWKLSNELLARDEFRARGLLEQMRVRCVCTTDDPADSLESHRKIEDDPGFSIRVLPTFRPDRSMAPEAGEAFASYLNRLEEAAGVDISSFQALLAALEKRHGYFHERGCRLSDHALVQPVYEEASDKELEEIFAKALGQKPLSETETSRFKTAILLHVGRLNAHRGWTMQLHIGALRNVNSRMAQALGADSGFDTMGDGPLARPLALFLDALDKNLELPRTILYALNPRDNELLSTMAGCFQDSRQPAKIQFGSAWWFNDQKDGMIRQLTALAQLGLLSRFVGMLTDSRSFLSYPRHEYFRRILCNLVGGWVEQGEAPGDIRFLGKMVRDICFYNVRDYLGIPLRENAD